MSDPSGAQEALKALVKDRFRVADLQQVLRPLGLSVSGRKAVLVDRVLASLAGTSVSAAQQAHAERLVRDVAKRQSDEAASRAATRQLTQRPTGAAATAASSMVRGVGPMEAEVRSRTVDADPFWTTLGNNVLGELVLPTQLRPAAMYNHVQTLERNFTLTPEQVRTMRQADHQLQAVCVSLSDDVRERFNWPCHAELRVNLTNVPNVPTRTQNGRLGKGGRDSPANIGPFCHAGDNRLVAVGIDTRQFAIQVRLVRRRLLPEVRELVSPKRSFEHYRNYAHECCVGTGDEEDQDDDFEVENPNTTVSVLCPVSGARICTPARFQDCKGLACFDLDNFLQLNSTGRKWACPMCPATGPVSAIYVDHFLKRIIETLDAEERGTAGAAATAIELTPDGRWRPAGRALEAPWRPPPSDQAPARSASSADAGGKDREQPDEAEATVDHRAQRPSDDDGQKPSSSSCAGEGGGAPSPHNDVIVIDDSDDEGGGGGGAGGRGGGRRGPESSGAQGRYVSTEEDEYLRAVAALFPNLDEPEREPDGCI